jgi:hypothetical protein
MVAVRHPQLIADWVAPTRGASRTERSSKVSDLPTQHAPLLLQTPTLLGHFHCGGMVDSTLEVA